MSHTYNIAIAGIGGVGGYYGALLAKTYEQSPEVSINFVVRGNHLLAIKEKGLLLEKDSGDVTAHPHSVTDDPAMLGPLDLIVFCCKAYDLRQLAASFSANITDKTVLLPLLNGVDSTGVLQEIFPRAKTLYGCTYLIAKKAADGVIKQVGDMNQLLFGGDAIDKNKLATIQEIFSKTGVNVDAPEDILMKQWEKFSFISPMATATTAFDSSIDVILGDEGKRAVLSRLMEEIVLVSKAEGINLPHNIIDLNKGKMEKLPAGATSSMHNDAKSGKNTELETLTGYVIRQAAKHSIDVPVYATQYAVLKERAGS